MEDLNSGVRRIAKFMDINNKAKLIFIQLWKEALSNI